MKILKPKTGHKGDTFRELLDMWEEAGLCELKASPDNFVWINEPGDVLLYDHPRLDDKQIPNFKIGLFGNTVPNCKFCYPWIFWGRSPKLLNSYKKYGKLFNERTIKTIFLGKIENSIQYNNRMKYDWSSAIELFEMSVNGDYKYSKKEYLMLLAKSKFGLCLPGYGPKCNREIELMAMGVVPIITPGVDLTYYNPLEENIHYIKVDSPEEIKEKILSISTEKWKEISKNCLDWYEKNASIHGSFEITKEIIKSIQ